MEVFCVVWFKHCIDIDLKKAPYSHSLSNATTSNLHQRNHHVPQ